MGANLHAGWCDEFASGRLSRPRAVLGRDQARWRRAPRHFDPRAEPPGFRNLVLSSVLGFLVCAVLVSLAGHAPDIRSRFASPVPLRGSLGGHSENPNSSARGLLLCALERLAEKGKDGYDVRVKLSSGVRGVSAISEATRVGARGARGETPGTKNLSREPLWAVVLAAAKTYGASPPHPPNPATAPLSATPRQRPGQLAPTPVAPARSLSFSEVLRPLAMLAHASAPQLAPPPASWDKIASMLGSLEASLKDTLPADATGSNSSRRVADSEAGPSGSGEPTLSEVFATPGARRAVAALRECLSLHPQHPAAGLSQRPEAGPSQGPEAGRLRPGRSEAGPSGSGRSEVGPSGHAGVALASLRPRQARNPKAGETHNMKKQVPHLSPLTSLLAAALGPLGPLPAWRRGVQARNPKVADAQNLNGKEAQKVYPVVADRMKGGGATPGAAPPPAAGAGRHAVPPSSPEAGLSGERITPEGGLSAERPSPQAGPSAETPEGGPSADRNSPEVGRSAERPGSEAGLTDKSRTPEAGPSVERLTPERGASAVGAGWSWDAGSVVTRRR